MMRDKLKKEEFFRKSLFFTDECIREFEKILPEIMKQDGTESQRVINGCNVLIIYYIKKVNLEYSLGEEISKVKESYEQLLIHYSQVWNMGQGYIELVRILSLGVLLRIDKSQMEALENKIRQEKFNDYFINFRNYSEPALLKDEIRVTCDRIFDCFVSIVSLFMCRAYVGHDF